MYFIIISFIYKVYMEAGQGPTGAWQAAGEKVAWAQHFIEVDSCSGGAAELGWSWADRGVDDRRPTDSSARFDGHGGRGCQPGLEQDRPHGRTTAGLQRARQLLAIK
uniref:Uncharacterized protein n=1 Tax=Manihot esculenta TaxID=3983 RepID=A0A2C9URV6_MANES